MKHVSLLTPAEIDLVRERFPDLGLRPEMSRADAIATILRSCTAYLEDLRGPRLGSVIPETDR